MATPSGLGTFPIAAVASSLGGTVVGTRHSRVELLPPPLSSDDGVGRDQGLFSVAHETSPPVAHRSDEPPFEPLPYRRWAPMLRNTALFLAGAALAGGIMLGLGWRAFAASDATSAVPSFAHSVPDERVASLLLEAQRAQGNGDLENAKEAYDKASVFRDNNPRVLLGLAQIACLRADVSWLRLRLGAAEPNAGDMATVRRELKEQVVRAQQAWEKASLVVPNEAATLRLHTDILRLADDVGAAKTMAARLPDPPDAETAYVLAALDVGGATGDLTAVRERLQFASKSEVNPGRARAMLVYVLAKTGDHPGARAELATIALSQRSYPLVGALRAWLAMPSVSASTAVSSALGVVPAPTPRAPSERVHNRTVDTKNPENFKEDDLQRKLTGASP